MSRDKSLKRKSGKSRMRNVLRRVERIVKLKEEDRWTDEQGPYNLPKVRVVKLVAKKAKKVVKADEADAKGKKGGKGGAKPAAAAAKPGAPAAKPAAAGKK